jgi:hypothetical protein
VEVVAADGHDVVTAVGRWVPYGFVLAHQEVGDRGGDAAERTRVGADVDVMPCSRVGKTGLLMLGWEWTRSWEEKGTLPTVCDMASGVLP